ncbi:phosphoribosyltransferase family protein [Rhodohalobacter sp. 614A]|uniref:phosphoribosyltransferase family protein n=1 Tax=Rhodohalobacter sp. 614A TaxID=2908649 RepID=UPI001F3BC90F|nr:phosphoribosyltransferase family protein [Rhodohalobacter sp. 614A]
MILLDKNRIERTIKRMSYQILEKAQTQSVCLVGLNERGYSLAQKIKTNLDEALDTSVTLKQLDSHDDSIPEFKSDEVKNSALFMIDDVIFSGQTMFKSIQKISELSGFEKIFVVVLVDRGHRKYPVLAGIVGVDAPTKLNEQVELRLKDDSPYEVVLIEK